MSYFTKTMVCTRCGFKEKSIVKVYGDFYGWDPKSLRLDPRQCPFCKHAKKLGIAIKEQQP